ncbi:transglutaminase-like cysteine peptidase [Altererythrobacter sp. MF3-039]|uniref:transglutaminase-like cysteine peptidase n=1 Tax=Altererythrobacter sp. MF3-039 TaxID=3252901 RepID=UPI00390C5C88
MEKHLSVSARLAAVAGASAIALGLAAPANAQAHTHGLMLPTAAAFVSQVECFQANRPTLRQQVMGNPQLSKSAAILGGASALERMRMAQSSGGASTTIASYVPNRKVQPAAGAISQTQSCSTYSSTGVSSFASIRKPAAARGNDILASNRISIRTTMFDSAWNRVRNSQLSKSRAARFLGSRPSDRLELIHRVNRVTNQRIRYVEDRVQWGRADFWAGANTTIVTGKGDCEDIAITKMQLLIANGFRSEDLTLSIVKDMIHGSDHAVLLVRYNGGYLMLDNVTDRILDGSKSNEYRPIFSYSDHKSWLHGYAVDV